MTTATEQFSSTAKNAEVRAFSAQVRQMQSDLATMSKSQRVSQFGFSSLEDSAIPVFDALGQARLSLGKQDDGSFAVRYVNGDPPPRPNQPIVSARQLGMFVAVDGTFVGGYKRPSDFARFDVHRSITSGFTPDGTTIVGSIPEDGGGVLLGADNQTYYVKVVAVSHSKTEDGGLIASAPTDEVPVLPLPATQLAAGAVGTQQLASDFIWSSRIVVGLEEGAHIELEGRDGEWPSLMAFDWYLNPTFSLDAYTGDVQIVGTIRSSLTGERIVWRETNDCDVRFYPATGNRWANLFSRTFTIGGVDYGGLLQQGPLYNNRRSFVWTTPQNVFIYRGVDGGAAAWSGLDVGDTAVDIYTRTDPAGSAQSLVHLDNNGFRATYGTSGIELNLSASFANLKWGTAIVQVGSGNGGEAVLLRDSSRYVTIQASSLDIRHTGTINFYAGHRYLAQSAIFANDTLRSGFYFATTGVDVYNNQTGAALAIAASAFVQKSAREGKTEIETLPFDSIEVIRRAPASMWEYLDDQRDERGRYRRAEKRFGPMADDMPTLLRRRTADGSPGLGLGDQIAVIWDATARQAETLDDHADALAHLGSRLDALARRLDAQGVA